MSISYVGRVRDTIPVNYPDWHKRAACLGLAFKNPKLNDALFFNDEPGRRPQAIVKMHREMCGGCPVIAACKQAKRQGDEYGNWGPPSGVSGAAAA